MVFLIGSLQRTLYQVARPVSEFVVDSFVSLRQYGVAPVEVLEEHCLLWLSRRRVLNLHCRLQPSHVKTVALSSLS